MIKKIRYILQSGVCLSDFTDKCKDYGACRRCEDEALKKLIAEHDAKIRADERKNVIDEVISLARAEIDFESQAEQKRFVDFMEGLKEEK